MTDAPRAPKKETAAEPRRRHSGSMPIRSKRFLPAVITSENLPAVVKSNLPAKRRKSKIADTGQ